MAQQGYKGFYCMGFWSFTMNEKNEKRGLILFHSESQWVAEFFIILLDDRSMVQWTRHREWAVSGKFHTAFGGKWFWTGRQRFH